MTTTITGDHAKNLIERGRLVRPRSSGDIFVQQIHLEAVVDVDGKTLEIHAGDFLAHDRGTSRTFVIPEAEFATGYAYQKPAAQKPRGPRTAASGNGSTETAPEPEDAAVDAEIDAALAATKPEAESALFADSAEAHAAE